MRHSGIVCAIGPLPSGGKKLTEGNRRPLPGGLAGGLERSAMTCWQRTAATVVEWPNRCMTSRREPPAAVAKVPDCGAGHEHRSPSTPAAQVAGCRIRRFGAHFERGIIDISQGELSRAIADFSDAIRINPRMGPGFSTKTFRIRCRSQAQ